MTKTFYANGAKITVIIDFSGGRHKKSPLERSAIARMIFVDIEREYGYVRTSLLGYTRTERLVKARHHLWFCLKQNGFTTNEIAELCNRPKNNGNGTSTIHYGIRRHKQRITKTTNTNATT